MTISFFIPGLAKTAGSKRAMPIFGKGADGARVWKRNIVTDDCETGKGWRESVQASAVEAMGGLDPLMDGALELTVIFVMPRLKSHYRANGDLKPNAPEHHTVKPDATKLVRAIEDALTAIVWKDDAMIARQVVEKRYGKKPGALVSIRVMDEVCDSPSPASGRSVDAPLFTH